MDWKQNLIEDSAGVRAALKNSKRLAIVGIKTEAQAMQPAFYVPKALQKGGWDIVPVPVYYPETKEILGLPVYRTLADIPGDIDMAIMFRRPNDIPKHVADLIAKKPRFAWFQLGIRNEKAAEELARAGIKVIQDRCSMVEARYV